MQPNFYLNTNSKLETKLSEEQFLTELFERSDRAEMQKYYQEVLEKYSPLFDRYAGKKRPVFEFTSDPNVPTAYFAVDEKGGNPHIKVGLDFFIKNKLSAGQAVWVLMHELTHFTDYASDRKEYIGQFANAKKLGTEMADRLAEYYRNKSSHAIDASTGAAKPKELTPSQMDSLKRQISKMYSSGYYNIINDIYVNHNVATTIEYTHDKNLNPNTKQNEVAGIYKGILFKDRDFSAMPEFYQYLYFLLRGENVSEGMRVTEGVYEALAKDYELQYKKNDRRRGIEVAAKKVLNTKELIDTFLNPNSVEQFEGDIKEVRVNNQKDTSLKYRSEYVDRTLQPTFSELLFNDLKNKLDDLDQKEKENAEGESGEPIDVLGDFLDDILDKMEECSPDFIPDNVMDQFAEWKESDDVREAKENAKKAAQDNKAKEDAKRNAAQENGEKVEQGEKAKEEAKQKALEDSVKNFAKQNNIAENVANRVVEARRDVAKYVDSLSELWKSIITGSGSESEINISGEYKTGSEVNVDAFVRQFDKVINREFEKLRIMKRAEHDEKPNDRPERIEVSLVVDQSLSMGSSSSSKNKIVERVVTLLQVSLDKFNQYLVNVKDKSKSQLHADAEVIAFGSTATQIASFRYKGSGVEGVESDLNSGKKGMQNFKTIDSIGNNMGNTYDDTALDKVIEGLSPDIREKIQTGKVLKIVFEITDGVSSDGIATKERIEKLVTEGVLVFAFQIGKVNEEERVIFEETWNTNQDKMQRGYVVGESFAILPEMIAKMLENFLGEVKIYE